MTGSKDFAVKEVCRIVKQCMESAHKLAAGGPDMPALVRTFEDDIKRLRTELSKGDIAKIIDDELAALDPADYPDFGMLSKAEFRELVSSEFRTSSRYHLERFVSFKSIIRASLTSARVDSVDAPKVRASEDVRSSKDVSEIVGESAHKYQTELFAVRRQSPSVRTKNDRSGRIEKKKIKKNISAGIANTLAAVVFLAANTMTMQMKTSAKFASDHFRTGASQLFG